MKFFIYRSFARDQWLLADQALVSAMNFVTSAMLARMLGVHNFGVFSIFYVVLQYLNSIQQAVIIGPMMSLTPQISARWRVGEFLSGIVRFQYIFSAGCCLAALIAAVLGEFHVISIRVDGALIFPFLCTIFFFQCQDWYRRFCYVREDGKEVFRNDAISYLGQVIALLLLWHFRQNSVMAAFYAIGMTSAVAFAVACTRTNLRGSTRHMTAALPDVWHMGKGLLVASQCQWVGSQGILLVIAAVAGVSALGGTRAAMTLMGPIVVLFQFVENVIPVRASRMYGKDGHTAMVVYLKHTATKLAVLVGFLTLVVAALARPLMASAFGESYEGFAILVLSLGLYMWFGVFLRMFQYYYRTIGRARVLAGAASFASVASLGASFAFARRYGAIGAIAAMILGEVLSIAVLGWRALRDSRRSHSDRTSCLIRTQAAGSRDS